MRLDAQLRRSFQEQLGVHQAAQLIVGQPFEELAKAPADGRSSLDVRRWGRNANAGPVLATDTDPWNSQWHH